MGSRVQKQSLRDDLWFLPPISLLPIAYLPTLFDSHREWAYCSVGARAARSCVFGEKGVTMRKLQGRRAGGAIAWMLALLMLFGMAPAAIAQGGTHAQRLQFPPNATGVTVNGSLGHSQSVRYVLWAQAGQTMTVQSWSDGGLVFVTIQDANGRVIGSTGGGSSWQGVLPAHGDYFVTLGTSAMGGGVNYSLRIDIVFGSSPNPPAQPERIQFAPGSTSTLVEGNLPANSQKQYILRAQAGQIMGIQSWGSGGPFRYTLQTGDGVQLGEAAGGASLYRTLPSTQDYLITVQTPTDTAGARYGMLISIVFADTPTPTPTPMPTAPPAVREIRFPPNTTNTTVWGYVSSSQPQVYWLGARAGQVMTVQLRTEGNAPARVTIATDRGIFLGAANQFENWQTTLPAAQAFFLTVYAPADTGGANYALFVDIR